MTIFSIDVIDGETVVIRNGENIISDSDYVSMLCSNPPQARQCVTCQRSGTPDEFFVLELGNREYSVCSVCNNTHGAECEGCCQRGSLRLNLTEYRLGDDTNILCAECYNNKCSQCRRCCENFLNEDMVIAERGKYCVPCSNAVFPRCKYCDKRHIDKNICRCGKVKPSGFLTNRYFSTEIEIVDPNRESTTSWASVGDSSISEGGIEYLSGPMVGKNAIDEIFSECQRLGGFIDDSCGFHLHIDFGEETEETVKKFSAACGVLENLAFDFVKPNRKTSKYCKPCGAAFINNLLNLPLDKAIYDTDDLSRIEYCKKNKYHESRYHWLNLHSYFYRGTIEIRQHHGTKNPQVIANWAELWLKIAEWSKQQSIRDIRSASADKIMSGCGLRSQTLSYFNNKKLSFYS